jgi:hypothetical protein
MQNLYFQIILIFILILFFIYRILVRTNNKVKKFNVKNNFINCIFVTLIGIFFYLLTEKGFIPILIAVIICNIIFPKRNKSKKEGNKKK